MTPAAPVNGLVRIRSNRSVQNQTGAACSFETQVACTSMAWTILQILKTLTQVIKHDF